MPLTPEKLGDVISLLLDEYRAEKERLDRITTYMGNDSSDIYVPKGANAEFRMLVDQSRFNVLPLVVTSIAQNLFVDGYRPTGENGRAPSTDNSPIWDAVWQPNRMDARQGSIYRSAITYGYSYCLVLPGDPVPVVTPYSPRKLTALYDDPANDEWPTYALVTRRAKNPEQADEGTRLTVYDNEFRYEVVNRGALGWRIVGEAEEHRLGVVPVIRFMDEWGDDRPKGKVEPLLPVQRQLNQTTYALLMAQHYGAFRQRWVTGMKIDPDNPEPFNMRVNAMLQAEEATSKFGEFSETSLDGYLNSRDKALLYVSAVAQIPPHNLLVGSGISNISAEALAALESAHRHDITEHQTSFGESIEQMLRLAGRALGGEDGMAAWRDASAQVVWRDTTPRSLAQVADALGKLAQQLQIPPEELWERIPGVTDQDIKRWRESKANAELEAEVDNLLREARQEEEQGAVTQGEPADAAA